MKTRKRRVAATRSNTRAFRSFMDGNDFVVKYISSRGDRLFILIIYSVIALWAYYWISFQNNIFIAIGGGIGIFFVLSKAITLLNLRPRFWPRTVRIDADYIQCNGLDFDRRNLRSLFYCGPIPEYRPKPNDKYAHVNQSVWFDYGDQEIRLKDLRLDQGLVTQMQRVLNHGLQVTTGNRKDDDEGNPEDFIDFGEEGTSPDRDWEPGRTPDFG